MTLTCIACGYKFNPQVVTDEDIRIYGDDWDFSDHSDCPVCGCDEVVC